MTIFTVVRNLEMKNRVKRFIVLLCVTLPMLLLVQCKKDESNPVTPAAPPLSPPTNLRAFSAGISSVGLLWDLSASESDTAFVNYALKVKDALGSIVATQSISKGNPTTVVTGLTEGSMYTFVLRSAGTGGTLSPDSASVVWSPARRLTTDSTNGPPIQVYEFASSAGASGLQFYSDSSGSARTQSLRPSNPDRALSDVYLATNNDGTISLNNLASTTLANPKNTVFSTVIRDATDLDDPQLAPPSISTYTSLTVQVLSSTVTQAKILYARSVTDNRYVRILLRKNPVTNLLFSGTSPNRYVTLQLSYQDSTGNMYCRPTSWPSDETHQ
jgi:hypothetical protein